MKHLLGKAAPMFLVLGIVSLTEAVVVCVWPSSSISALGYLFPFAIILQGAMQFVYSTYKSFEYPWLLVLYLGVINIATGHFMIFYPNINDVVLLICVGMTWVS